MNRIYQISCTNFPQVERRAKSNWRLGGRGKKFWPTGVYHYTGGSSASPRVRLLIGSGWASTKSCFRWCSSSVCHFLLSKWGGGKSDSVTHLILMWQIWYWCDTSVRKTIWYKLFHQWMRRRAVFSELNQIDTKRLKASQTEPKNQHAFLVWSIS